MSESDQRRARLAREAETLRGGLLGELWGYLRNNKKWWLLPILAMLLLASLLVVVGSGSLAPLIYALF
jgi:hypothetical protein